MSGVQFDNAGGQIASNMTGFSQELLYDAKKPSVLNPKYWHV